LSVVLISHIIAGIAIADESKPTGNTIGVVLSNLPPPESRAYRALKIISGAASGEILEMTKSEMWSVPRDRLENFKTAAEAKGVGLTILDETWNHTLAPMQDGGAMTKQQAGMMHAAMDSKAAMAVAMMGLPQSNVLEYALTKGMSAAGADGGSAPELLLPLNANLTVKARRTSITKTAENYIWHGEIAETGDPVTLLWWPGGRMSGTVTYAGHVYSIKNFGGTMHGVVEMAPLDLPPEHAPMSDIQKQKMNLKDDPLVSKGDASILMPPRPEKLENLRDAGHAQSKGKDSLALNVPKSAPPPPKPWTEMTTITAIVAYTKAAASRYSDIEKDLVTLAIEEANQSFRNSGIPNVQLQLVYSYRTGYSETGGHFDHVSRFAEKHDGQMDEIHQLRDKHRADVAILIVHDPVGCGLAAGVAVNEDRAFAVVHHECAANSYSLAHEIGHLIGARHDFGIDDSIAPFSFGHGYVNGTKWRTMMSYEQSCNKCPRLPVWSNPEILIRGDRAGSESSNNARVIREQAKRVAGFR
jgi:Metallo-peptidase family M12